MCFAPANVAAYLYTPLELRGAAVGLLSLLRNEGGSVGTSMAQTLQERRDQFHTLRLGEYLDPFNPAVSSFLEQAQALFLQQTGDPVCRAAAGLAGARESAPAASIGAGLFRRLLDFRRGDAGAGARGAADETLGGRERRSYRGRMTGAHIRARDDGRRVAPHHRANTAALGSDGREPRLPRPPPYFLVSGPSKTQYPSSLILAAPSWTEPTTASCGRRRPWPCVDATAIVEAWPRRSAPAAPPAGSCPSRSCRRR